MADKKLFNLSGIKNIFGNDEETIKHMIQIFVDSTPETLEELNQAHLQKNPENLARSAHKMKPSLDLLKIDQLYDIVRSIDKIDKVEEMPKEELNEVVEAMNRVLNIVFEQLKRELS